MRKLESEDLPFVRKCNKLREITGCIKTCLKTSQREWFQGRFIMDAGLLFEKQWTRHFFYKKDPVTQAQKFFPVEEL